MWHDFNRLQKVKLDSIWYLPIKFLISLLIIFHSSKNMPCQGGLDKIFVCAYTEAVQKKWHTRSERMCHSSCRIPSACCPQGAWENAGEGTGEDMNVDRKSRVAESQPCDFPVKPKILACPGIFSAKTTWRRLAQFVVPQFLLLARQKIYIAQSGNRDLFFGMQEGTH